MSTSATSSSSPFAPGPNPSTNNDTASIYKDLIEFLQSPRLDLRLEAAKAVIQVIHDRNQVLSFLDHGVLVPVLRLASDSSHLECSETALRAILFLSSSVEQVTNQCVETLIEAKAVPRLVELVLSNQQPQIINLSLAILANLTRTEQGAIELVGTTLPEYAVKKNKTTTTTEAEVEEHLSLRPTMSLLLERYCNRDWIQGQPDYSTLEPQQWDTLVDDPFQHFAAILMNVTQVESGRKFVLKLPKEEGGKSVLEVLLPQLQSTNPIRRRGIAGMLRNCCLERESVWWMLNVVHVLTPILYPLAGPEELDMDEKVGMDPDLWLPGPDKQREYDTLTRQNLVETILLLCASGRQSRQTLRLARTYVILKYADMVEESETVSERINECVQYLRRDEEGTEEGSSDRLVDEHIGKLQPSSQITGEAGDYDDID